MRIPLQNKITPDDSWFAEEKHVATYSGQYFTIMSERGLEIYNKSEPQKLVSVYEGDKFIVSSSDDEDFQIYRL
jgi:hypothetical protein